MKVFLILMLAIWNFYSWNLLLSLGALVMFGSSVGFSDVGSVFAGQFIELYTSTLGESVYPIIVIAAFTTMFSTTLTTLDASPRSMYKSSQLLFPKTNF